MKRWNEMHTSSSSAVSVRESFCQSAWVYCAISIICEWMISNPFVVTRDGEPDPNSPLGKLVKHPNSYGQQNTCNKFRAAYMHELLLNGSVIRVFTKMNGIVPEKMVAFPRSDFTATAEEDDAGVEQPVRWTKFGARRQHQYIEGDDAHLDALLNPYHDWEGLSPLASALLGINADINLGNLLNRFFQNNASTGLIMASDQPVTEQQLTEAVSAWDAVYKGIDNSYKTKFIGYGFKPYPISQGFDAAVQRILKVLSRDEIMNGVFRIPPVIYAGELPAEGVQIGARSTEPDKKTFLTNVIMVWADRFDEEFNLDVAPRFGPEYAGNHDFTQNPILESDRLTMALAAAELIDRGVTLNHVIDWLRLGLQHEPHGNEYFLNQGQVPASVVMKAGERALNTRSYTEPARRPGADDKKTGGSRKQYLDSILTLAQTAEVAELAQAEYRRHHGELLVTRDGNGRQTNAQRIANIMANID
jgi:hypothetical protein